MLFRTILEFLLYIYLVQMFSDILYSFMATKKCQLIDAVNVCAANKASSRRSSMIRGNCFHRPPQTDGNKQILLSHKTAIFLLKRNSRCQLLLLKCRQKNKNKIKVCFDYAIALILNAFSNAVVNRIRAKHIFILICVPSPIYMEKISLTLLHLLQLLLT